MSRNDDEAESRRIIRRVGAETEASMVKRASDHMAARDADENDWVEMWGTRIGRALGIVLVIYLGWRLIDFIVQGG